MEGWGFITTCYSGGLLTPVTFPVASLARGPWLRVLLITNTKSFVSFCLWTMSLPVERFISHVAGRRVLEAPGRRTPVPGCGLFCSCSGKITVEKNPAVKQHIIINIRTLKRLCKKLCLFLSKNYTSWKLPLLWRRKCLVVGGCENIIDCYFLLLFLIILCFFLYISTLSFWCYDFIIFHNFDRTWLSSPKWCEDLFIQCFQVTKPNCPLTQDGINDTWMKPKPGFRAECGSGQTNGARPEPDRLSLFIPPTQSLMFPPVTATLGLKEYHLKFYVCTRPNPGSCCHSPLDLMCVTVFPTTHWLYICREALQSPGRLLLPGRAILLSLYWSDTVPFSDPWGGELTLNQSPPRPGGTAGVSAHPISLCPSLHLCLRGQALACAVDGGKRPHTGREWNSRCIEGREQKACQRHGPLASRRKTETVISRSLACPLQQLHGHYRVRTPLVSFPFIAKTRAELALNAYRAQSQTTANARRGQGCRETERRLIVSAPFEKTRSGDKKKMEGRYNWRWAGEVLLLVGRSAALPVLHLQTIQHFIHLGTNTPKLGMKWKHT